MDIPWLARVVGERGLGTCVVPIVNVVFLESDTEAMRKGVKDEVPNTVIRERMGQVPKTNN